jgi:hypothetical protein
MIKALIPAAVIVSALAAPSFAFAQDNGPVTRAQVEAELAQLERAGYNAGADHNAYPAHIQAAEARVAAQNAASSSFGGVVGSSSASGAPSSVHPASNDYMKPVYFGN